MQLGWQMLSLSVSFHLSRFALWFLVSLLLSLSACLSLHPHRRYPPAVLHSLSLSVSLPPYTSLPHLSFPPSLPSLPILHLYVQAPELVGCAQQVPIPLSY